MVACVCNSPVSAGVGVTAVSVNIPTLRGERYRDLQDLRARLLTCREHDPLLEAIENVPIRVLPERHAWVARPRRADRHLPGIDFDGFMFDDHVPRTNDDTVWNHRGRAHVIGYKPGVLSMPSHMPAWPWPNAITVAGAAHRARQGIGSHSNVSYPFTEPLVMPWTMNRCETK